MTARVFGHPATAKRAEVRRAAMLAVAQARAEAYRELECEWMRRQMYVEAHPLAGLDCAQRIGKSEKVGRLVGDEGDQHVVIEEIVHGESSRCDRCVALAAAEALVLEAGA